VTELLPCPFCGSPPRYAFEEDVWHLVRCENRKCDVQSGIFPTKPMAFSAWNKRAGGVAQAGQVPTEVMAALDAIQAQCDEMRSLKGWRLNLIRENLAKAKAALTLSSTHSKCEHKRKTGGGSVNEDGSWLQYWHCSDCGASGSDSGPVVSSTEEK
jgi:Lar family restriction alleviation protein